ncbi:hypothetical protein HanXRQr2_Chr03g0128811 [Helianthus annuus]|uniref:Transmembrane protein n=1 Tax=Helianthus annuus TaxID=4232 RepID=A0A9K3JJH4_HELAN|nr:hypothetical protein HanXRQr2_Chr03g0128811 [Helianthus annuus]
MVTLIRWFINLKLTEEWHVMAATFAFLFIFLFFFNWWSCRGPLMLVEFVGWWEGGGD